MTTLSLVDQNLVTCGLHTDIYGHLLVKRKQRGVTSPRRTETCVVCKRSEDKTLPATFTLALYLPRCCTLTGWVRSVDIPGSAKAGVFAGSGTPAFRLVPLYRRSDKHQRVCWVCLCPIFLEPSETSESLCISLSDPY